MILSDASNKLMPSSQFIVGNEPGHLRDRRADLRGLLQFPQGRFVLRSSKGLIQNPIGAGIATFGNH